MSTGLSLLTRDTKGVQRWKRYLCDSLLAGGSIVLLTGMLFLFHLYPSIPDSTLAYLLAILALASTRGLYASLLAAASAFFFFDFLLVPPVYGLITTQFTDLLTLLLFMIAAVMTSQLASALRERAEQASRRERETRLLYDFMQAANREEDLERQLQIFVHAIVEIFSPWGIRDCVVLLPHVPGKLSPRASVLQPPERVILSPEEETMLAFVMQHAQTMDVSEGATDAQGNVDQRDQARGNIAAKEHQRRRYIRLVPLQAKQQVIGVLHLLIEEDPQRGISADSLGKEQAHATPHTLFFSTFLEQAITVIERDRLRHQSMHLKLLQHIDALYTALLSSVSYDLRTPLTTIKAVATSLLQEEMHWSPEEQRSFISAIDHETNRLNAFVENLLDISRIEAGTLVLQKVWYPLDELLLDVLDQMRPQLQGRNVSVSVPDDLPPVELDAAYLHQVFTHLIENAIHYTPPKTPLDISIQPQETQVQMSVADRGPGISPEEQEAIFDKFYRVQFGGQQASASKGLGFGLAICRGIVEAHGGHIWVEAREGGGAIFHFTLPLSQGEQIPL